MAIKLNLKKMKKTLIILICAMMMLPLSSVTAYGESSGSSVNSDNAAADTSSDAALPDDAEALESTDITKSCVISADKTDSGDFITDGKDATVYTGDSENCAVEITSDTPIGGIYIRFSKIPGDRWLITDGNVTVPVGSPEFLHQYIDIAGLFPKTPRRIVLMFGDIQPTICDVYVFSEGTPPSWVQRWNDPYERADLMLMPTHSDDEHLFFAGILPYCAANGINAQVVYMVNHNDSRVRPHELLDGLWEAGVTHYPAIGEAPDLYSEGMEQAEMVFEAAGYPREHFVAWQVENIRRFKPLVVVEHADNGEYGHGAHILNNNTMKEAVVLSGDAANYPESAEKYGTWDVPKLYIHVYDKNQIVLDWDKPLDYFGGRTAFQVSQDAYRYHKSQHVFTSLSDWLYGKDRVSVTAASQIGPNSPCKFGLYRTLVGDDVEKNSFFENLTLWSDVPQTEPPAETEPETVPETESAPETSPEEIPENSDGGGFLNTAWKKYVSLFGGDTLPATVILVIALGLVIMIIAAAVMAAAKAARRKKRRRRNSRRYRW